MTLDSLITKLENIQIEGLFEEDASLCGAAHQFFKRDDVQRRMIELNQSQMEDDTADRYGKLHNHYSPRVAKRRAKENKPHDRYTFNDTSTFFHEMEVMVEDTYVFIPQPATKDYFEYLFHQYATENDLGLSDENLLSLMPDLVDETIKYIKDYLNG